MNVLQIKTTVFIMVLIQKMWMWTCQRAERDCQVHTMTESDGFVFAEQKKWKWEICHWNWCEKHWLNVMKHLCLPSIAQAKGETHYSAKGYRVYAQKFPCIVMDHPPLRRIAFYDDVIHNCEIKKEMRGVFVAPVCASQCRSVCLSLLVPRQSNDVSWYDLKLA